MKNHWLQKREEKSSKFNQKLLDEAKACEKAWENAMLCGGGGLWDWQQNAVAIYLDGQRLKNEQDSNSDGCVGTSS